MTWPPTDATELLAAWERAGRPEIPLRQGVTLVAMEPWLDSAPMRSVADLEAELRAVKAALGLSHD